MLRRALAALAALVALVGGLVLPSTAATAATRSTISITSRVYVPRAPKYLEVATSLPTAIPGEHVVLSGSVTASSGRVVVLQRYVRGAWREVDRRTVSGSSWRFSTVALQPARYPYRAVALRTRTAGSATSATRVVVVVRPTVSLVAASTVEVGRLVTFTGRAVPARAGRLAQLWELRGPRWVAVADTTQSSTGTFALRQLAPSSGQHTYRVVTQAASGRFDVRSAGHVTTTVRASAAGTRSAYLGDVTPAGQFYERYRVQSVVVGGHSYAKSVLTSAGRLTWQLGAGTRSISTALALQPLTAAPGAFPMTGPQLVEVRVGSALRLRRFMRVGQVVPLTLDVTAEHTLTVTSIDRGPLDNGAGAAVVLVTPVVSTAARGERGVDAGTALSELPVVARTGAVLTGQVLGSTDSTLYGGSLELDSSTLMPTRAGTVEYDLAGAYTHLTGVPLIALEGRAGVTTGRVRVYGDGTLLATLEAGAAGPAASVDVTGVRRLRVELVADPTPDSYGIFGWAVALADPRLS